METRYYITLDRVPEVLYPEICGNKDQWEEWEALCAVAELQPKRTSDFLSNNPYLMLDTRHFDREFTLKLLASIENLDASLNGVCFRAENFQALRIMQERYRERVKCVYIDPPYNASGSEILYKNNYKHSSWGTMVLERLVGLYSLLRRDGVAFESIDKLERTILERALDAVFGRENRIEELIWTQNTANSHLATHSTNHEYVEAYANGRLRELTAERDTLTASLNATEPPRLDSKIVMTYRLQTEKLTEFGQSAERKRLLRVWVQKAAARPNRSCGENQLSSARDRCERRGCGGWI